MDNSWDEYDAYDLSEFSAADLVHIDNNAGTTATTTRHNHTTASDEEEEVTGAARRRVVGTGGSGGLPQVAVALEPAADKSVVIKVAGGGGGGGGGSGSGSGDNVAVLDAAPRSPFELFRSRGTLSVSDLVGPAWCEVQFDYGLRQGRSLALAHRPDSFVSAGGKAMTVDKKLAKVNEKVLERGRSVHEKLEREVFPMPVRVEINLEEEFWAARLVNMLACLGTLAQLGYSREMPVFGIVQDRPIVGIIDEVLLKSIPQSEAMPNSWNKRAPTSPGTPQKSKKQRESSPTQSDPTDFFASPSKTKARKSVSPPRPMVHELSLIDTKTRRSNSLPSDDDAFSARMQLMLYHHLLSALLSPTFSFSAFWEKVQVDPFAQLSDAFLLQSGLAPRSSRHSAHLQRVNGQVPKISKVIEAFGACLDDLADLWHLTVNSLGCAECLDDLADLWHLTVNSLQVQGVSPTLEIIYRTQPKRGAAAAVAVAEVSRPGISDDDFGAADREARDIARAIEASRQEYEHDSDLQRAIVESLREVTPREDSEAELGNGGNSVADTRPSLPDMPHNRWYGRSVETKSTQSEAVEREGECGTAKLGTGASKPEGPQPKASSVIGRKNFAFSEAAMQTYVKDVLQWWRGERPPRGVDVEHSRRCFSCEYREDCEWREMKAKEAREKYVVHKFR
ncbi:exonuclease V a 5' deoxyribonuclease-domain-containing protein [Russula ochroleuca]|uniref:Exonuclease V a 5' deoxyribonuclease-domain-containing protein n=1 Tax=Russula ochroleuca TaxID=152965 RepID=A0A9P5TA45_9AGAM|nr:exonuclease V a 5' deoxyribonuclease-domain-containing protein [Russula ochroleuca]